MNSKNNACIYVQQGANIKLSNHAFKILQIFLTSDIHG